MMTRGPTRKLNGYEAANGSTIANLGEKMCWVSAEGGNGNMVMHFQVADIKKPLLSIPKVADMGFECVLGKNGGFLLGTDSGNKIHIQRTMQFVHDEAMDQRCQ